MVYTWIKAGASKYQMISNGEIYATVFRSEGYMPWCVYVDGGLVQRCKTLKTAKESAQGSAATYYAHR